MVVRAMILFGTSGAILIGGSGKDTILEARPPFIAVEDRHIEDGRVFVKHLSENRLLLDFLKMKRRKDACLICVPQNFISWE